MEPRPPSQRGPSRRGHARGRWLLGVLVAAFVVGVVAVTAFGRGSGRPVEVSVTGSPAAAVGAAAPAFSLPTLSGSPFVYPTHRPTLLYFMAGWCGTCVPEAQALGRLQASVGSAAVLLAVDADPSDTWASMRSFAKELGAPGHDFGKDDGRVDAAFGVNELDTTVVLDASGRVVSRTIGALDDAGLRAALAKVGE